MATADRLMQWNRVRNGAVVAMFLAAVLASVRPAGADETARRWTVADTLAALQSATPRAGCIVARETGFTYEPYVVGDGGTSLGVAQLHSPGLRDVFERDGWGDPFNPYQAVAFLDWALAHGLAESWTPVRWGLC